MIKRAVITGATGAIGNALINELIKHNIEVLVICREGSERNDSIPKNPLIKILYCDISSLGSVEKTTECYDVFFHLAWMGTTGAARDDMYLQNLNVRYALDAVELAKKLGCKRFIGAGSQAEYGRYEGLLKPDTQTKPENGYGMAKLCAGLMTKKHAEMMKLEHIWVRILSVYGPFDNPNSMVASTVDKLKNNISPEFTKGEQMWDYLHSSDAARALYLMSEKGISGKTYVLGSGKAMPLKDYIEIIRSTVNLECEVKLGALEYSHNQVMHLQADISELTKDTGFKPEMEFKDGIKALL